MFRVALLQYPIVWADKEQNLSLTEQRVRKLRGRADLALLPEMFTTGFCTDRPELAEYMDGRTMTRLQQLADSTDIAIAGSFIAKEEFSTHLNNQEQTQTALYNRGFIIRPHDEPQFVDKRHLYAHGENEFFTAGEERVIMEYKGVKIRMLICYDLRFPVWARNMTGSDYDLLLVCANWPEVRVQYWDALIPARATENHCYIAAVNTVGDDGMGMHYNGHSVAYDTYLNPIAHLKDNEEGTVIAEFDIDKLHHYRQVLPLWKDADKFEL